MTEDHYSIQFQFTVAPGLFLLSNLLHGIQQAVYHAPASRRGVEKPGGYSLYGRPKSGNTEPALVAAETGKAIPVYQQTPVD